MRGVKGNPTQADQLPTTPTQPVFSSQAVGHESTELVLEFIRRSDTRGGDVRLDCTDFMAPHVWPRRPVDVRRWAWKQLFRHRWRREGHITALELLAALLAIKWWLAVPQRLRCRFLHLIDNQAVVGVLVKGRSSSVVLSQILSKLNALLLAGAAVGYFGYCETDTNPADYGTRHEAGEAEGCLSAEEHATSSAAGFNPYPQPLFGCRKSVFGMDCIYRFTSSC